MTEDTTAVRERVELLANQIDQINRRIDDIESRLNERSNGGDP